MEADNILKDLLDEFGITIDKDWGQLRGEWNEGLWKLDDLKTTAQGIKDFADKIGTVQTFRDKIGPATIQRRAGEAGSILDGPANGHFGFTANGVVTLWNGAFDHGEDYAKSTVVHELAHVWDKVGFANPNGGPLAEAMQTAIGTHAWFGGWGPYDTSNSTPQGPNKDYAETSPREDWAVTVAAWVYNDSLTVTPDRGNFLAKFRAINP